MAEISSFEFSQMTDLIRRSFTYVQKTLPQVMRNSSFVISDVLPHGTGDTRRYAQRIHRTQYAGIRGE
jgi:hypothetical protein